MTRSDLDDVIEPLDATDMRLELEGTSLRWSLTIHNPNVGWHAISVWATAQVHDPAKPNHAPAWSIELPEVPAGDSVRADGVIDGVPTGSTSPSIDVDDAEWLDDKEWTWWEGSS